MSVRGVKHVMLTPASVLSEKRTVLEHVGCLEQPATVPGVGISVLLEVPVKKEVAHARSVKWIAQVHVRNLEPTKIVPIAGTPVTTW